MFSMYFQSDGTQFGTLPGAVPDTKAEEPQAPDPGLEVQGL